MTEKKTRDKILEIIKEEDIQPTPRWVFTLKSTGGWVAFLVAVLLGGLAFSVIIYAIQQSDFSLGDHLGHSGLEMVLSLLPFIWLMLVILFFLVSILGIRHSWKGYKLPVLKQAGWSIGLSITIGTLFFIAGGGGWLDSAFGKTLGAYETIEERKMQVWSNPEEGYHSGTIEQVSTESLTLKDFENKAWTIDISEAWIAPPVLLEPGEQVKMLGDLQGDSGFKADEIRPWGGRKSIRKK
jgi:hypothetical protein